MDTIYPCDGAKTIFGGFYESLSTKEKMAVDDDIQAIDEEDFGTTGEYIASARLLKTRIGGANILPIYVKSLTAKTRN